jgi:glycosyltransferase involved in cell wall biosynthesis
MIYLAIYANPIIEKLFWRGVVLNSRSNAAFVHVLRRYEVYLLNYFESRIDLNFLQQLEMQLKPMKFLFGRKSRGYGSALINSQPNEKINESLNGSVSGTFVKSGKKDRREFPKISIVTPNYNQGKFLKRCIQSVLLQNYPNLEYIIIDGGSIDNSVQVIKEFEDKITYWVSEEDFGQADAINKGLKQVTGDIFNWLNADDYLEPDALFQCAEAYLQNADSMGWIGGCRRIDEMNNVLTVTYPNGIDRKNIGANWNGRQFYQPSCFLSAKIVKAIGGLDPDLHFALDLDLWLRLLEKGRFTIGKGVWSNAIIHNEAKTQKRKKEMSRETLNLQIKYGFTPSSSTVKKFNFRKEQIQRAKELTEVNLKSLPSYSTITFISNVFPRCYDDPWRSRLMTILRTLIEKKWKVDYLCTTTQGCKQEELLEFEGKINFFPIIPSKEKLQQFLSENTSEYTWITSSTEAKYLEFITEAASFISNANSSTILLDYCDLYYKKYFAYCHKKSPIVDVINELDYQKRISTLSYFAKRIIIPNKITQQLIHIDPGAENKFFVIPHVYSAERCLPPLRKRKNICFLTSFESHHNLNKVNDFIKEVLSLIAKRHPQTQLHCIVDDPTENHKQVKSRYVKKVHSESNLRWLLKNYRLCIFPCGSSSTWNDGIGLAAGVGLPVVLSSQATEGYPLTEGHDCFVADDAREFAEKCCQCLGDWITWHNFSFNLHLMVAEKFSEAEVVRGISNLFSIKNKAKIFGSV